MDQFLGQFLDQFLGQFWGDFRDWNELREKCWRTITLRPCLMYHWEECIFGTTFWTILWTDFRTVFATVLMTVLGTVLWKVLGTNPLNNDFCMENWKMCRKRTNNLIGTPDFRITCPNVSKSKNKSYFGTILTKNNLYTMAREQWFQI